MVLSFNNISLSLVTLGVGLQRLEPVGKVIVGRPSMFVFNTFNLRKGIGPLFLGVARD
jgi:hypothetical protein